MSVREARAPRFALPIVLGVMIAAEGLISVRIGFPSFDLRYALVVLVSGWLVVVAGLVAWHQAPWSRTGPQLLAMASAWYIGGFGWVAFEPLAELALALDLVWTAIATLALLTFPTGRAASWPVRGVIAAAFVAALLPVPRADVLVAGVLLFGSAVAWLLAPDARHERRPALLVGVLFAVVLGGHRWVPAWLGGPGWLDTRPLLDVALVVLAWGMTISLARAAGRVDRIADVIVELRTNPGTDLVHELRALLADPDLRLGFWDPSRDRHVDATGRHVEPSGGKSEQVVTQLSRDGAPVARLLHHRSTSLDERTRGAVVRAVELAAANARLQAEVREKVMDVRDSRYRLLVAGDDERIRLEQALFEALDPRFDALEATLTQQPLWAERAAQAAFEQVRETRSEISALIRGWGPAALDERGVAGALSDLADRAPIRVDLEVGETAVASRVTLSALVFVTSEALVNVTKHADASLVTIRLAQADDHVAIDIDDDGRGGADVSAGSGLQGLRDRVEALGGRFVLESQPGMGTHLGVRLPVVDVMP